ncbi:MAG TPA: DUF937 domain-containing protein [Clostridiaceae bacterium]|nr:DUF937 domain-containing protein [Clostridiaceae bacterium]
MDLSKLLAQSGLIEQLANQFNLGSDQVEKVVENGLPRISSAINENAASENGLNSFLKALTDHKDDDVKGMLQNVNKVDTEDGSKILGHIFGERKPAYEEELSQEQGISVSNVSGILSSLAPILMGLMGSQLKKGGKSADLGLQNIIGSFLGDNSSVTKAASSFLDEDQGGNFFKDLLGKIFNR